MCILLLVIFLSLLSFLPLNFPKRNDFLTYVFLSVLYYVTFFYVTFRISDQRMYLIYFITFHSVQASEVVIRLV